MRVLCIDSDSNALDFLMRCKAWGHECRWFDRPRKDGSERRAGEGIITKIRDYDSIWSKWLGWADLIYLPGNEFYLERLEPYRMIGYPIYACNAEASQWESDRALGQRVMKKAGLQTIEGKEFHDYESAIAHVKRAGEPLVSKPSGEADKALSYVAHSAADLVYMLAKWSKNPKYRADAKEHGFILQAKKVGCEMGIGGWFGPGGWCGMWEEAFEFKKLMNDDLGVNTGEQGTLTRFVKKSLLAEKVLKPLTKALREVDYVGCVNVNCIIDEDGVPWPLEFTVRDGWPATHNQCALHEGDPAQWMRDLIDGKDTREVRYDEAAISVVVSMPDYPYSHLTAKETEGIPIYGAGDFEHVHLSEAMLCPSVPVQAGEKVVEMPCYVTAGDYVMVVTGTGETITGARRSAYTALDKIKIPGNPMWRTDIGRGKLVETIPRIQALGYASGLSY